MTTANKIEAIETAALAAGVSVKFYDSRTAALGQGAGTDFTHAHVAGDKAALVAFRNMLNKSAAMVGSKISKIAASAGHWNMGVACDVSYSRVVTL